MGETDTDNPFLTAVVTCHYEEGTIETFYNRLKNALESLGRSYEIVMINDGSTDGTWNKLKEIYEKDTSIRVIIDFAQNSGQFAAIAAGVKEARGAAILLMDSDLQLSPEELPNLIAEYDKGYDLVTGFREHRKDSLSRIIPSRIANHIMRAASKSQVSDFGCTYKVFRASILKGLNPGPHNVFNFVQIISTVQHIKEIPVTHHSRQHGKSGWTFAKLWRYNMDNIILLLERPFQYIALFCGLFGALLVLRIAVSTFSDYTILNEVTNGLLLNAIAFTLFVSTSLMALIGEFAVRNFAKLQKLPAYIVREKLERNRTAE